MDHKEAIKIIKAHYPTENYKRLREALDLAVKVLQKDADFIENEVTK